jgi:hypothetical protein
MQLSHSTSATKSLNILFIKKTRLSIFMIAIMCYCFVHKINPVENVNNFADKDPFSKRLKSEVEEI